MIVTKMNKLLPMLLLALILFNGCQNTKETYLEDGTLVSRIDYRGKKKNGTATEYYHNGCTKSILHYKNDLEDGLCQYFNEDGVKVMEVEMKAGKKNGRMRTFFFDGSLQSDATFSNDLLNGVQRTFSRESGQISETAFVNGKENGPYKAWHSKNLLKCTGSYKDGLWDGKWQYFDEREFLVGEGTFSKGTGKQISYDSNGNLYKITNYVNGQKEGEEIYYNADSTVAKTIVYHDDRMVSVDGNPVIRDVNEE